MNREEIKPFIAKRVAKELHDGDVVNIGLPTMVPAFLPENVHVTLHAENGIIHAGGHPGEEAEPAYVVDAGGKPASVQTGGAFIDSSVSFSLIRGGHIDCTVLGALEVDEKGNLSLDYPGQDRTGNGWGNGPCHWCKEGHRCHGAYCQRAPENFEAMYASIHCGKLC